MDPRNANDSNYYQHYKPRQVDIKEMLKNEIYERQQTTTCKPPCKSSCKTKSATSCDLHFEKNRPCPTSIFGVSDQYIVLDSSRKAYSSDPANGMFSFNFMVNGVTRDQNIGISNVLDNIIEMQVMPFCIPLLPENSYILNNPQANLGLPRLVSNGGAPAAGSLSGALTQLPFCNHITMYLEEIGRQSVSDGNTRRHHFEFDAALTPAANAISLTPSGTDTFIFTDPIKDIHGITVRFYNPYETVNFPDDVMYNVSPTSTIAPPFLDFQLNIGQTHNLVAGDRIYVTGMQTANSVINTYINRKEGLLVGAGTTATNIRLNPDVDTTPLGAPPASGFPSGSVNIIIAKNVIRIPLRLRRVIDRVTNYITPT